MLGIKPQLQHKGGEDVSSFLTTRPGTLTYFKMENRMPGMNITWAPAGPMNRGRLCEVFTLDHLVAMCD